MIREICLGVLLLFTVMSCNKEVEKEQVQSKQHENFCSTVKEPNLISSSRVSHQYITSDDIIKHMDMAMKSIVKNKRYFKIELRPELGEYTIKMFDFENDEARKSKLAYLKNKEDHKARINTNDLRTIHSTTDGYYADLLYRNLMGQIWDYPHLFSPCEQDLTIFEFNGVWYVEDCC